MTNRLKLSILADVRDQLDKAGHALHDGKNVEARNIVNGTIRALRTFEGITALPPSVTGPETHEDEPDSTNVPEQVLWGY